MGGDFVAQGAGAGTGSSPLRPTAPTGHETVIVQVCVAGRRPMLLAVDSSVFLRRCMHYCVPSWQWSRRCPGLLLFCVLTATPAPVEWEGRPAPLQTCPCVPWHLQHMNLADNAGVATSVVDIDQPLFQPSPPVVEFAGFGDFTTVEASISFRNIDKVCCTLRLLTSLRCGGPRACEAHSLWLHVCVFVYACACMVCGRAGGSPAEAGAH